MLARSRLSFSLEYSLQIITVYEVRRVVKLKGLHSPEIGFKSIIVVYLQVHTPDVRL